MLEGFPVAPLAIPQIVLATALLVMFAHTVLRGTVLILIIGLTAAYLPFGARTISSVFLQVNEELKHTRKGQQRVVAWGLMILGSMLLVGPAHTHTAVRYSHRHAVAASCLP